jgi:hypothetical protein
MFLVVLARSPAGQPPDECRHEIHDPPLSREGVAARCNGGSGLGGAKVLDLEDQDKVATVVIPPKKPKPCSKRGAFAIIFGSGGTLFLLGVLAKTGGRTWFFDGEVVVDCW